MIYIKLDGLILDKKRIKENDGLIYILTKKYGILKCLLKGIYQAQSKNLSLLESGNFNRFFILTDLEKFRVISSLPIKIPLKSFKKNPYIFLWALKLIKNLNLPQTPPLVWFILLHLENYLKNNEKNFPPWFLFQVLKELGYEPDIERCHNCQRKLTKFAFFDRKRFLYCLNCKKESYLKIEEKELKKAKEIKNPINVPKDIPDFLKIILRFSLKHISKFEL